MVVWVLAGILIIVPALVLRASLSRGTPSGLDEALLRITAPLQAGVSWIIEGIGGVWSRYVALVDVDRIDADERVPAGRHWLPQLLQFQSIGTSIHTHPNGLHGAVSLIIVQLMKPWVKRTVW